MPRSHRPSAGKAILSLTHRVPQNPSFRWRPGDQPRALFAAAQNVGIARLALRPRHFINHEVVVNNPVKLDQCRNGSRFHHRCLGVGSCKSSNSVHGLPPGEDEKFNLIAELTPTQMRPDKSWNLA